MRTAAAVAAAAAAASAVRPISWELDPFPPALDSWKKSTAAAATEDEEAETTTTTDKTLVEEENCLKKSAAPPTTSYLTYVRSSTNRARGGWADQFRGAVVVAATLPSTYYIVLSPGPHRQ